jgi:hypothetical protein
LEQIVGISGAYLDLFRSVGSDSGNDSGAEYDEEENDPRDEGKSIAGKVNGPLRRSKSPATRGTTREAGRLKAV